MIPLKSSSSGMTRRISMKEYMIPLKSFSYGMTRRISMKEYMIPLKSFSYGMTRIMLRHFHFRKFLSVAAFDCATQFVLLVKIGNEVSLYAGS